MSMDPACPQSLPCCEASDSRDCSPIPVTLGPEENYSSLQMCSAEMLHTETASPLPSSMGQLIQDSPDSSTSPMIKLHGPGFVESAAKKEDIKVLVKKQKMRTVFSQTQLCVLNDTFQRQKYLSLQQMQELSSVLNLSYKQVKTWFQNQRMKCKRWQKSNWPVNNSSLTEEGSASTEYPGLHSNYSQGCLGNTAGNLPMWSNQTWNSQSWSNHSWTAQTWYTQAWNTQAWNSPFHSFREESLQPYVQFQQNLSVSDLEATLETAGESYNYFSSTQALDLFLNHSVNVQPDDV